MKKKILKWFYKIFPIYGILCLILLVNPITQKWIDFRIVGFLGLIAMILWVIFYKMDIDPKKRWNNE